MVVWVSDTCSLDYTSVNISIYITSFINGYVSIRHTFIRLYQLQFSRASTLLWSSRLLFCTGFCFSQLLLYCDQAGYCLAQLLLYCDQAGFCLAQLLLYCDQAGYCLAQLLLYCDQAGYCLAQLLLYCDQEGFCLAQLLLYCDQAGFCLVQFLLYCDQAGFCLAQLLLYCDQAGFCFSHENISLNMEFFLQNQLHHLFNYPSHALMFNCGGNSFKEW